jgi:hypothetical protein
MQRPDTIIEIHRERVQDQTVEMFGGAKLQRLPRRCGQDNATDGK